MKRRDGLKKEYRETIMLMLKVVSVLENCSVADIINPNTSAGILNQPKNKKTREVILQVNKLIDTNGLEDINKKTEMPFAHFTDEEYTNALEANKSIRKWIAEFCPAEVLVLELEK
jgi:hypothetical protein